MNKETAKKLLPLVNNEEAMYGLEAWIEDRINYRHIQLETDLKDNVGTHQGALVELRLLQKDFRQRVLDGVK